MTIVFRNKSLSVDEEFLCVNFKGDIFETISK